MTDTFTKIVELWVYPVKACRGVKVDSAKVTPTGLEHDRSWCIVDLNGTHVPKLEAISQRRMPCLATIEVSFNQEGKICMDAPGMSQLCLPTTPSDIMKAMDAAPSLTAECAGATASGRWSLGSIDCRVHPEGSKWVTDYLNQPKSDDDSGRLINGKMKKGQFALVRSLGVVDMATYPPIFPLIERAKIDPEYKKRFEGNVRLFSDFSPFLLVSRSSARQLADLCATKEYPITSFRANIVVDGDSLAPWEEESWSSLEITSSPTMNNANNEASPLLTLRTIKQCPRCTVPCRDQITGQFLFSPEKLKLWTVLKHAFPRKFSDPEWGSWAGAYFGVYMGHTTKPKKGSRLAVGNVVTPVEILPWDAHLRYSYFMITTNNLLVMVSAAVGAVAIVASVLRLLMNT